MDFLDRQSCSTAEDPRSDHRRREDPDPPAINAATGLSQHADVVPSRRGDATIMAAEMHAVVTRGGSLKELELWA